MKKILKVILFILIFSGIGFAIGYFLVGKQ